ncbi:ATP-binding protein [Halocola ammonii]
MRTITKLIVSFIAFLAFLPTYAQEPAELSADSLLQLSKGKIYNDPDLAAEYAKLAVKKARATDSASTETLGLIYLGVISEIQADYDAGFEYLNRAREIARENNLNDREGLALINLGNIHFRLKNFDFSIRYFLDANHLFRLSGNDRYTAAVLNNLAILYEEYKEYDKALTYLDSAEVLFKNLGKDVDLTRIMEARARVFTFTDQPEKAIPLLDSIMSVNLKDSSSYDLSLNYFNYGRAQLAIGDTSKAIENFEMALDHFEEMGMLREIGETNIEIGSILSERGENQRALKYVQAGIEKFKETNDIKRLQHAFNVQGEIQIALGLKDDALQSYELANQWDDTLSEQNFEQMKDRLQITQNSIRQREELFETQVANRVLEEKAESRTNWLTIISILLAVSLILGVWLFNSLRQKQKYLSTLKSLNEKIAHQNEELEELNEVKNRMFSIIGHDLRSPLASLHGSLQLINAGKMTEEEKSMMLTSLSEAVTHTRVTIDNLFHWAREEMNGASMKKKVFDLSDVIEDTLPLYDYMMKQKGIHFNHSCEESLPVFADRDQLRFVLRNLVHNAFKFTPHGGSVEVTCSKSEKGSDTVVEVRDTGVGIPKRNLEALQSGVDLLSSRGTQKEIGSGLGLKMSFLFMEQNDGNLEVESSEGSGTVFRIVLPAASEAKS